MSDGREMLEALGLPWPEPSAELRDFVDGKYVRYTRCINVERVINYQEHWFGPPRPPIREVPIEDVDFDDDDDVVLTRRLTDEEWAEALRRHEKAMKEWWRTGGLHLERGCEIVTGEFILENGGLVKARYAGEAWHVFEYVGP